VADGVFTPVGMLACICVESKLLTSVGNLFSTQVWMFSKASTISRCEELTHCKGQNQPSSPSIWGLTLRNVLAAQNHVCGSAKASRTCGHDHFLRPVTSVPLLLEAIRAARTSDTHEAKVEALTIRHCSFTFAEPPDLTRRSQHDHACERRQKSKTS
jgi:hypothetical protein